PIGEEKVVPTKVKNINLPKNIGKVFWTDKQGKNRWASGVSIQSKYRNLVVTAAHNVYDTAGTGDADVLKNWVFVPGYYQGKTPYGIYVGKTAWTHYDFDVYEDYDRDYAFVTVYNGVFYNGKKQVTEAEYKSFTGPKYVEETKKQVTKAEYEKWVGTTGHAGEIVDEVKTQTTGPDDKRGTYKPVEVSKKDYDDAAAVGGPSVIKPGAQAFSDTVVVSKEEYDKHVDGPTGTKGTTNGQWNITHYYVKQWVIAGSEAKYFIKDYGFFIELSKDAGRLGDNVGGQGFAWNQKTGQPVFIFGYPQAPEPDGDKHFTGITPKWVYGKTSGKVYVSAAQKIEEHIGVKGDLTPGADGGPWVLKYNNAKRLGYVNGVTSQFGDQDKNGRNDLITSAYFDGETADIYKKAALTWSGKITGPNGELYK
ncbi:hypothetical protein AB0395_30145, partial [Streptosporangium sp. NPDC051023]|uniref:trypsin-like serine peptidase n=1 Tax=Streptosporangium sp. NPDC051023 TaxID=3155410 RepID=UPI00344EA631